MTVLQKEKTSEVCQALPEYDNCLLAIHFKESRKTSEVCHNTKVVLRDGFTINLKRNPEFTTPRLLSLRITKLGALRSKTDDTPTPARPVA